MSGTSPDDTKNITSLFQERAGERLKNILAKNNLYAILING
jgi:hypothetical protein